MLETSEIACPGDKHNHADSGRYSHTKCSRYFSFVLKLEDLPRRVGLHFRLSRERILQFHTLNSFLYVSNVSWLPVVPHLILQSLKVPNLFSISSTIVSALLQLATT